MLCNEFNVCSVCNVCISQLETQVHKRGEGQVYKRRESQVYKRVVVRGIP